MLQQQPSSSYRFVYAKQKTNSIKELKVPETPVRRRGVLPRKSKTPGDAASTPGIRMEEAAPVITAGQVITGAVIVPPPAEKHANPIPPSLAQCNFPCNLFLHSKRAFFGFSCLFGLKNLQLTLIILCRGARVLKKALKSAESKYILDVVFFQ